LMLAEASEELEVVGFVRQERFTHDLLFEASLENVPRAAKPLLHSRVLDVLEQLGFRAAVLVPHAVGSNNHFKAFEYGVTAGIEATNLFEYGVANHFFDHAYILYKSHLKEWDISVDKTVRTIWNFLTTHAYTFHWIGGRFNEKIIVVEEMSHFALLIGEQDLIFAAKLAMLQEQFGTERIELADKLYEMAKKENRPELLCLAEIELGRFTDEKRYLNKFLVESRMQVHHLELALKYALEFKESGRQLNHYFDQKNADGLLAEVLGYWLARMQVRVGKFHESETNFSHAVQIANLSEDKHDLIWILKEFAWSKILRGQNAEAEKLLSEALEKALIFWSPKNRLNVYVALWTVQIEQGKYFEVLQSYHRLVSSFSEHFGDQWSLIYYSVASMHLGRFSGVEKPVVRRSENPVLGLPDPRALVYPALLMLLGRYQDAYVETKRNLATRDHSEISFPFIINFWHSEIAALLHAGDVEAARGEIAARAPHVVNFERLQISFLRSRSVLEQYEHQFENALQSLMLALELATKIGLPGECWEIEAEIAHLHDTLHHTDLAAAARSRAMTIRDALAANIPDETMNRTYLEFTQKQIDLPIWKWHADDTQA
jgi:tetratricopeptide (TPR) repeat protein